MILWLFKRRFWSRGCKAMNGKCLFIEYGLMVNYERHKFCQFTKQNAFRKSMSSGGKIIGNFANTKKNKSQFTPPQNDIIKSSTLVQHYLSTLEEN